MWIANGEEKSVSPTQLSLKFLRAEGYTVEVVEHYNYFTKRRKDLFGIIDILALRDDETLAVQTTSYSNMSARASKIAEAETIDAIRKAGWTFLIHGWHKVGHRWQVKIKDVS